MQAISEYYDLGGYHMDFPSNSGFEMEEFYLLETIDQTDNEITLYAKYKIISNYNLSEKDFESKFTLIKHGIRYEVTDMFD